MQLSKLAFFLSVVVNLATATFSFGQSGHVYQSVPGPICSGVATQFYYMGNCSSASLSWQATGGGVVSGSGQMVNVTWPSAATGVNVIAHCNSNLSYTGSLASAVNVTASGGTATVGISGPSSVCAGTNVTYYVSSSTNGGSSPTFAWKVTTSSGTTTVQNGSSSSYSTSTLANGSVVFVQMTSSITCISNFPNSNSISVSVTQPDPVSVRISDPGPFCNNINGNVQFTAFPVNGGSSPSYVWYRGLNGGGVNMNDNQSTTPGVYWPHYTLQAGEKISCLLTPTPGCNTGNAPSTNTVTIQIITPTTPVANINYQGPNVCAGQTTFTVSPGGAYSLNAPFTWTINGNVQPGNTSSFQPLAGQLPAGSQTIGVSSAASGTCISPNSASGSLPVTVKGVPIASASDQTICSGSSTSVFISNPNNVPGTVFNWTATPVNNVTGYSNSGGSTISQILSVADGVSQGKVKYTITPSVPSGCTGATIDVFVTVNPTPQITNTSTQLQVTVCSGVTLNFTPTISISGGTYSWTSSISGPIDPATVSGSGTNAITNAPVNTGSITGKVTYHITPLLNGCSGGIADYVVTVNPVTNALATPAFQSFCLNGTTSIALSNPNGVGGTTFSWTVSSNPNVTGSSGGSGTSIAQPLTVSGSGDQSITYTITPRANNCDGTQTTAQVSMINPPPPNAANFTFCEWVSSDLTSYGYPFGGTIKWYNTSEQLQNTGIIYSPILNPGSYTYRMRSVNSVGCQGLSYSNAVATVQSNCDPYLNWVQNTAYTDGGSPVPVQSSKDYFNGFGDPIQSQALNISANLVLAAQPVKDNYNQNVLSTLPAPINSSTFVYRHRFMTNASNLKYNAVDFDSDPNNPSPVANGGVGTLGWYYSSSNNLEPQTPTTLYPYSRSWSPAGPDPVIGKSASSGDLYKMGSGHEVTQERQTFIKSELSNYFSLRQYFTTEALPVSLAGANLITTNPDATSTSGYTATTGVAATAVTLNGETYVQAVNNQNTGTPGIWPIQGNYSVTPGSVYTFQVKGYRSSSIPASLYVRNVTAGTDIITEGATLPGGSGSETWVENSFVIPVGCTSISVGVLWRRPVVGDSFFINAVSLISLSNAESMMFGYKLISTDPDGKKSITFTDADGRTLASAVITNPGVTPSTYDFWTYTYYNTSGKVLGTVAPQGITGSNANPAYKTTFFYDQFGRLIKSVTPDAGTSQFVYSTDGKIRFSQNQEQFNANPKRFSYTNYDRLDRPIESGEYTQGNYVFEPESTTTPAGNSVLNTAILNNIGSGGLNNLEVTSCSEVSSISYDSPAGDFQSDASHLSQSFLYGHISRTSGSGGTTWYNYDDRGHLVWTKQLIGTTQSPAWTTLVSTALTSGALAKTTSTYAWDAGAFSANYISAGAAGYVEFSAGQTNAHKMMGLSGSDGGPNNAYINFGLFLSDIGNVSVIENGVHRSDNVTTYTTSDVFRIERQGTSIVYKKNGVQFFTSPTSSSGALYGDCSIFTPSGSFKNMVIGGPGFNKTIDYAYDFLGNVTKVGYQVGQTDAFYHFYTYDADQRLSTVSTNKDGSATTTARAKYYYYLHGPLKRVELGTNLQGIDYVYTINGSLKSINSADPSKDPGTDGSGVHASFTADSFGETLNYTDNDYSGAGYTAGTFTTSGLTNNYSGLIKSAAWHTPIDDTPAKKVYGFTYDNINRLQNAQWGTLDGANTATLSTTVYREGITGYDKNGNIASLVRNGKAGSSLATYSYTNETTTNRLDYVTNTAVTPSVVTDFTYNTIGQMTKEVEGTAYTLNVTYTPYGLVKEVRDASNNLLQSYTYDDRGSLIMKIVGASATPLIPVKKTFYVRDVNGMTMGVYEQPPLIGSPVLKEVPIYGASRIGMMKPGATAQTDRYLYELNDHLGNVRTVIGSLPDDIYLATMETENPTVVAKENSQFKNMGTSYINTAANNTPGGDEIVRVNNGSPNGSYPGRIAGPGIVLKVSPGDYISAEVWASYQSSTGNLNNTLPISSIVTAVAAIFGGSSGVPGDPGKIFNSFNSTYATPGFAGAVGSTNATIPAAYLNMIMFDPNLLTDSSLPMSAIPISGNPDTKQKLSIGPIRIPSPGYVYIWVNDDSNTNTWVYFDDLKVTQVHSAIVAGGDFYPFGLAMNDRQVAIDPYRYGYQGQYSEKDSLSGWNTFELRMYEARFGRWLKTDPKGQFRSPYIGMGNNPVGGVDPSGGEFFDIFANAAGKEAWFETAEEAAKAGFATLVKQDLPEVLITIGRLPSVATAGAARAAAALAKLGGKTWTVKSPIKPKFEWTDDMVRGRSSEFRFDDKNTDCVETVMDILRGTDPEIYEALTEKYGSGRGGTVSSVRQKIVNRGGRFRLTDPMVGDLMIWDDPEDGSGHIEMVVSANADRVHGDTFIEVYGSGSNKVPVPRVSGKGWLKVGGEGMEGGIHPASLSPFVGYWTPF